MKTTFITVMVALFTMVGGYGQNTMDAFEVQVDGLGCPFCAYGLEKKFKEFKGIKEVAIDIETGDFSFQYPSEKALTLAAVEQQVVKAGYTPMSLKITRADGAIEEKGGSQSAISDNAQMTDASVYVAGKCGMCEARIEKATLDIAGVTAAAWDKDSKVLKVSFDRSQASADLIEKAIAKVGHDTKNHKASIESYEALPGCCKYERLQ